jgi:hypothetical protein
MAKYLISFPSAAMVVPDGEWEAVGRDAHAVIDEAKAAGVYVFGGGIDEAVPPVLVSADGTFSAGGYSIPLLREYRDRAGSKVFALQKVRVRQADEQVKAKGCRSLRQDYKPVFVS